MEPRQIEFYTFHRRYSPLKRRLPSPVHFLLLKFVEIWRSVWDSLVPVASVYLPTNLSSVYTIALALIPPPPPPPAPTTLH